VSDAADRDGEDTLLGDGRLAVTIECGGAGFSQDRAGDCGPRRGSSRTKRCLLLNPHLRSLSRYNHDDALEYEERMREYAEEDKGHQEQYEFPELKKALPECIQSARSRRTITTHFFDGRGVFFPSTGKRTIAPGSSVWARSTGSRGSGCQPTADFLFPFHDSNRR
jgi:hypothetical protein